MIENADRNNTTHYFHLSKDWSNKTSPVILAGKFVNYNDEQDFIFLCI